MTGENVEGLRVGLAVEDGGGVRLGTVTDVWADVGVAESFGATGSLAMDGAEASEPTLAAFSEAMPGEGDSYFRLETAAGEQLYVPFSYVSDVRQDAVVVSVAVDDLPAMQWDVRPDFLSNHDVPDSGAPSSQA